MSEWLKGLAGYFLISSVIMQMLPNGKYEPYLRLITGFLLILLVLQPVLKIKDIEGFLDRKIETFLAEQEKIEEEIEIQSRLFQERSKEMESRETQMIEVEKVQQIIVEVTMND